MELQNNTENLSRPRSTERLRSLAQVEVIKKELGDLEGIRKFLGLSQRKMCQLLLVDPSAWTRWVKQKGAPPHIYRMLEWYMVIEEKHPSLAQAYWRVGSQHQAENEQIQNLQKALIETQKSHLILEKKIKNLVRIGAIGFLLFALGFFALTHR